MSSVVGTCSNCGKNLYDLGFYSAPLWIWCRSCYSDAEREVKDLRDDVDGLYKAQKELRAAIEDLRAQVVRLTRCSGGWITYDQFEEWRQAGEASKQWLEKQSGGANDPKDRENL
jgi:hypothetical protein